MKSILKDDPMIAYLVKKHIKQKTIEALYKHEFDSLDALKLVTDDDIQELNVSKGQARLLKVAVNGNVTLLVMSI